LFQYLYLFRTHPHTFLCPAKSQNSSLSGKITLNDV
jgi:hypothetical protein